MTNMLKKVFNWSEVYLSEMTCYEIHTLGILPNYKPPPGCFAYLALLPHQKRPDFSKDVFLKLKFLKEIRIILFFNKKKCQSSGIQ